MDDPALRRDRAPAGSAPRPGSSSLFVSFTIGGDLPEFSPAQPPTGAVLFLATANLPRARRVTLAVAGLCGLAGLIIEHGTYPGPRVLGLARVLDGVAVVLFLAEQVLSGIEFRSFRGYLERRWPTFGLSVLLLLEAGFLLAGRETAWLAGLLGSLAVDSVTRAYLVIVQFYILSVFVVELPHLHRRFASMRVRPAAAFVMAFAGLILVGALLLTLPRATPGDRPLGLVDALFTSTSAVCVTGLIVRDTGAGFTVFGQTVILVLIQLGGLGIMSLTAAISLLLGRGIGVRESHLLREVFHVPTLSAAGRTVRQIILMTLALEAVGTALIYRGLDGVVADRGERLFTAVFHAVSAFCNAGFSTYDDSLISLADNALVVGTVAGLLIVGGLGFGVLVQIVAWARGRALRGRGGARPLGLHARVVLVLSAALLFGGAALLAGLEWNGGLAAAGPGQKLAHAFFQSATCRTAGFNTLDLTTLGPAALFLMIVLMFIGGAPGSTAGGVKVTTVAIVWANLRAIGQGLLRVRLGGRELDQVHVQRSMLVLSTGLAMAAISVLVLLATEKAEFLPTVFEAFSAIGTVGLSLGLTPALSPLGRIVIIVLMFVGRLGPLTLASSLTGDPRESRVRLPRGRIIIG